MRAPMIYDHPTTIATNNVELEVFSTGQGRPVVLCHGWPEHAYSWRHQVEPLVDAGYHVIVPNQRGYGHSTRPPAVEDYDINALTGDLAGLLDHYGYADALFVGHDWGAIVVWNMALIHSPRVQGIINLSVPFMQRGPTEWVGFWESQLGGDFYIVHFNRQPGVADAVFDEHCETLLRNMYRTGGWGAPAPDLSGGMPLINMAQPGVEMPGRLMMSETELEVFVNAFGNSGFTGGLNWYRNFSRNWEILGAYDEHIEQPTLMIYGAYDSVPQSANLADVVPNVETHTLQCGHWIQQEKPEETNTLMLEWLQRHYPA
ncbi:MAG: alpha/beta hydrolase [Pseudomonadota bacterium]